MYTYVRGRGWEPEPECPTIEYVGNGIRITIEYRPPKTGERYWSWSLDFDGALSRLEAGLKHYADKEHIGQLGGTCVIETEGPAAVIVYHGPA